jgi:hypothetical protein
MTPHNLITDMPKPSGKKLLDTVDRAVKKFNGQGPDLESAIGMLFMGQYYGWKVMYLMHDKKTLAKYNEILGIDDIRDVMDETGPLTHRSVAWKLLQNVTNFWKAVTGAIPGIRSPYIDKS